MPAGALALLAALAGFGFFKSRQRQAAESSDSSFLQALGPNETHEPEPAQEAPGLNLDLSLHMPHQPLEVLHEALEDAHEATPELQAESAPVRVAKSHDLETVFDLPDLNLPKLDLGSLALDKATASDEAPAANLNEHSEAMTTKLELAQEFIAIGDEHGARALIEEVITEASGAMKIKAQIALNQLQPS